MQTSCPQCSQRIVVDDAKAPDRPFSVRCPKCQTLVRFPGRSVEASADPTAAAAQEPAAAAPAMPPRPTRGGASAEIDDLFWTLCEMKASDLHISAGSPPLLRHDGDIKPIEGRPVLSGADTQRLLWPLRCEMPGQRPPFLWSAGIR